MHEVIRVKKRPSSFVTIDKTFLEDERLSYKAKGILAYLLSKPDNWKVVVADLVNHSTDGKSSVYAGLKELKEFGYYEKVPIRNEQGTRIIRWESTVYEVPMSVLSDFQEVEKQEIENEKIENKEVQNEYIEKLERNNNDNTKKLYKSNNQVQSCPNRQMELDAILNIIYENIDYESFQISHKEDIPLVNEIVSIMLDTLLSSNNSIRINGEMKSIELVRRNLMKLAYDDVEFVLEQFKEQGKRIKKKRQYILTMLYNAALERNAHYINWVNVDWG